jgi:O-antigen ligase
MPVAEAPWTKAAAILREQRLDRWFCFAFAGCLAAYTLSTQDGGEIASRFISAVLFLLIASYLFLRPVRPALHLPLIALLLMSLYGIAQTLWFPQRIVYDGWSGVLFWFTAAAITFLAEQLLRDPRRASLFRHIFVLFGSAVCILDLLEQASRTNRYFWLIPSKYEYVFGSFAYWNNFAQFVELLLPVTLWLAFGRRKPDPRYIFLAALEISAVGASGSRAGTALIFAELIAMLLLAYWRNRNQIFLYAGAATLVVSALFVYAAGTSQVVQKFSQSDQWSVRREVNRSSLAMIERRPLSGWGLESYVSVYPMFARMDSGAYVNRAHNDWLQWAAEGGIFFAGLMLVVFVWSIRPAVRSFWGIGLIAVCLHAAVDYPFARFGVCGWYFALLGMLAVWEPEERRLRRPTGEQEQAAR